MISRLGLAVVCFCALVTAGWGQELIILSPKADSVINSGTLIGARILQPPERQLPYSVRFFFSSDGETYTEIVGPAPDGLAPYSALWNTQSLPGGRYFLKVEATLREERPESAPLVKIITVLVNEQPVATARVISTKRPLQVILDGRKSIDRDGKIVSYRWDFENGTFARGARVVHRYARPGHYAFELAVTDDRGGVSKTHHTIDIVRRKAPGKRVQIIDKLKDKCGCSRMRIRDDDKEITGPAGLEFEEDTSDIPPAEAKKLGGYNDGAAGGKLDLTKGPFTLATRFEVVADLTKDSEPALCKEGQRVKRTTYSKGVTEDKEGKFSSDPRYDSDKGPDPYAPSAPAGAATEGKCGLTGDKWCDDDYHGGAKADGSGKRGDSPPNGYKKYDGEKRILWIDAPGVRGLTKDDIKDKGYSYGAKFEAIVSGAGGSCKCSWQVHIDVVKDGTINGNEVTDIDCTP